MMRVGLLYWGLLGLLVFSPSLVSCGQGDDDSAGDDDSGSDDDDDAGPDDDDDTGGGSEGCGEDPTGIAQSLEVAGENRTFELYLPADYDPAYAYPLIFAWHGGGGTGTWARSYMGLDGAAGADAVVVYPDGLDDGWGTTVWDLDPESFDFAFFDEMLAHLKANLCIDDARLFSTGWSLGGYMSNSLGCYRADVLNAFAPCSGGPARPKDEDDPLFWGPCNGQAAAMVIHGTYDDVIPLSEGEMARDIFLANNECDESTSPTDPAPCVAYDGCATPLHWCEFSGGHEWPDFVGDGIWQFFSSQDPVRQRSPNGGAPR